MTAFAGAYTIRRCPMELKDLETPADPTDAPAPRLGGGAGFFADYFWFLVKNVVGWIFILLAFLLGPVPGPGGIVVFLIGFGMISFPGKRRLIVRVFRGRRFDLGG